MRFGRKKSDPLEAYGGVPAKDRQVLRALIDHGADLRAPRHVLHFLYVDSEELGRAAAASVPDWVAAVKPPVEGYETWSLVFERHGYVLTPENVKNDAERFAAIADAASGTYDGWEASV
jgi:hypothetical protein